MGDTRELIMRSDGIPLGITHESAKAVLKKGFYRQRVSQERIDKLKLIRAYVIAYIEQFGSVDDKHEWIEFFKKIIPAAPVTRDNSAPIFTSYLHLLYAEYGGTPRRKSRHHCRRRDSLSKYTEPMVFPEAAWTQGERDASAQYAVSTDFDKRLLYDKGDLKRVPKKRKRKALKDNSSASQQLEAKASEKGSRQKRATIIAGDTAPKKRGRPKQRRKSETSSDDEQSFCSGSTLSSTTCAPSMKSNDDSDIGSGFGLSDTDDCGSVASTVDSDFSMTDVVKISANIKFKELANSYQAKVGKLFEDTDNHVVYRIIGLCRLDNDDMLGERGKVRFVDKLLFKYVPNDISSSSVDDDEFDINDIEKSLCSEMMDDNCNWVRWLE
jgi:hypothetical protein